MASVHKRTDKETKSLTIIVLTLINRFSFISSMSTCPVQTVISHIFINDVQIPLLVIVTLVSGTGLTCVERAAVLAREAAHGGAPARRHHGLVAQHQRARLNCTQHVAYRNTIAQLSNSYNNNTLPTAKLNDF